MCEKLTSKECGALRRLGVNSKQIRKTGSNTMGDVYQLCDPVGIWPDGVFLWCTDMEIYRTLARKVLAACEGRI